jgi:hypothetical protein
MSQIEEEQIITGERVQTRCEKMIGTPKRFDCNPFVKGNNFKPKKVFLNSPKNLECGSVCIYGDLVDNIYNFNFSKDVSVYVHNSDRNITPNMKRLFERPNVKKVYAQNLLIPTDEKYRILPIGIANRMWKHGNTKLLHSVISKRNKKVNDVFFNFSVNTNKKARSECHRILVSKGFKFLPNVPQEQYLETLSTYKYCICPEGNGVDCHRIWECLYLGVVPICKNNTLSQNLLKEGFKIEVVDDWNSLDLNTLIQKYKPFEQDYTKLKIDYYF